MTLQADPQNPDTQLSPGAPTGPARNERGASLVEYALLIALIALALFTAVGSLGDQVNDRFDSGTNMLSVANASAS